VQPESTKLTKIEAALDDVKSAQVTGSGWEQNILRKKAS